MRNARQGTKAYFNAKMDGINRMILEGDLDDAQAELTFLKKVPKYNGNTSYKKEMTLLADEISIQKQQRKVAEIQANTEREFYTQVEQARYMIHDEKDPIAAKDILDIMSSHGEYKNEKFMPILTTLYQELDILGREIKDNDVDSWEDVARRNGQPLGL